MKDRNIFSLLVLTIIGSSIIYMGNQGHHVFLSYISAFLLFLPVLVLFSFFQKKFNHQGLYEMLGKRGIGWILSLLLIIYSILLASRIIFKYVDFVTVTNIYIESKIVLYLFLFLLLIIIFSIKKEGWGGFPQVSIFLVILFTLTVFLMCLQKMDWSHLLPIIPIYMNEYGKNTFLFLAEPFCEALLILVLPMKKKKTLFFGYFVGFFILLIFVVMSLSLLGENTILKMVFPFFSSLSMIEFMDSINRIEILGIILFFFTAFNKVFLCLICATEGITHLFSKIKKPIYWVAFFSFVLSMFIHNSMELRFINNFYAFAILGLIALILVFLLFKKSDKT